MVYVMGPILEAIMVILNSLIYYFLCQNVTDLCYLFLDVVIDG